MSVDHSVVRLLVQLVVPPDDCWCLTLLPLIVLVRSPTTSTISRELFVRFGRDSKMFQSWLDRNIVYLHQSCMIVSQSVVRSFSNHLNIYYWSCDRYSPIVDDRTTTRTPTTIRTITYHQFPSNLNIKPQNGDRSKPCRFVTNRMIQKSYDPV